MTDKPPSKMSGAERRKYYGYKKTYKHNGRTTKFDKGRFIAWDGEGISPVEDMPQNYVLFGASTGDYLTNLDGLDTDACLGLLIRVAETNRHAIHVIYGGTYDANQILKDLPEDTLRRLLAGKRAYYSDYNLEWRVGKCLWIAYCPRNDEGRRVKRISMRLWDVLPFFQQSFVKTLRTWGISDEKTIADMEATKSRRDTFSSDELPGIIDYWQSELRCLVDLMDRFHGELRSVNYRLSRWDGPGAVASFLYKAHSTKAAMIPDSYRTIPEVSRAAQHAYAGGRFEMFKVGRHPDTVYSYDINSAYPSVIATLPSLAGTTWVHHTCKNKHAPARPFSLYRIRFRSYTKKELDRLGHPPFPLWQRRPNGCVSYGPGVEGWYWTPEYEAALLYYGNDIDVIEWYEWQGDPDNRPFAWVEDVYRQRQEYKRQGMGAERILKLGLNSLYGKMVQQLGAREDADGWHLPPFHQLEWGGYVTSATRAKLFLAASLNPSAVIAFETDGLFSMEPLPLDVGKGLGQWEADTIEGGITYVQSGVYWKGSGECKYRGFDPGSLNVDDVHHNWRTYPGIESKVTGRTTRFQGASYSLHTGDMEHWRAWRRTERSLSVIPTSKFGRRLPPRKAVGLDERMVQCELYGKADAPEGLSEPYRLLWVDDAIAMKETEEQLWFDGVEALGVDREDQ